jgi:uncharacterized membrane protein YdjX (TVP38/TMEM64 family)
VAEEYPRTALRLLAALAAILLLFAFGRRAAGLLPQLTGSVEALGPWGPMAFVAGYAVATVAFVPGSVLTLAAGAIFGLAAGTIYTLMGATLGASVAFLIARYAARGAVERRLLGSPRFAALDRAIGAEGRKIVFLLRLSPIFPFNVLNYALGLTRVGFRDYLVASAGMIPGTVLYVYYGKVIGDVASLAGASGVSRGAGYWAVTVLGLAATVAVTVLITRAARRALAGAEASR